VNVNTNDVIFNSTIDQHDWHIARHLVEHQVIDICVPNGKYQFIVTDSYGDGFTTPEEIEAVGGASVVEELYGCDATIPFLEIFVNGTSVEKIEGNFGGQVGVEITSEATVMLWSPSWMAITTKILTMMIVIYIIA
jgi:hypothetical protein